MTVPLQLDELDQGLGDNSGLKQAVAALQLQVATMTLQLETKASQADLDTLTLVVSALTSDVADGFAKQDIIGDSLGLLETAVNDGTTGLATKASQTSLDVAKAVADAAEIRTRWFYGIRMTDCQAYPIHALDTAGVSVSGGRTQASRMVDLVGAPRTKITFIQRNAATGMTQFSGVVYLLVNGVWTLARVTPDATAVQAANVRHSLTLLDPVTLQPSPLVTAKGQAVAGGITGTWTTNIMAGKNLSTTAIMGGGVAGDWACLAASAVNSPTVGFNTAAISQWIWVALE